MTLPLPLRVLFIAHGAVTAAAGVALIVSPALVPSAVGIVLPPDANLLSYLLGAVELAVAVLSVAAVRMSDAPTIRLIAVVFVVMHLVTAAVEVLAIVQGTSPLLWGNVALRLIVAALFLVVVRVSTATSHRAASG